MKIPRIYANLDNFLKPGKVLIIYGPRQVGKTTLLRDFLSTTKLKYKLDSGDDIRLQETLSSQNIAIIKEYAAGYDLLAIDEAQKIPHIGQALKILIDQVSNLKVIATGSSSFELAGQIGEPLTGRKTTLTLFPISQLELSALYNRHELKERLEESLRYGGYPEVVAARDMAEKTRILQEIAGSYALKDIFEFERIKNQKTILDLLRLLAFQIGNEVSLSEIGTQLGIDYKTVARYISLLEQSFVIYRLGGFSRNLRKEITKKNKYYFYDVGIRNAIIANMNPLRLRDDVGALWENFLVMERVKKQSYRVIYANNYFWRTWDQKEIDFVEERGGCLYGYEFKWGARAMKPPKEWQGAYPQAEFQIIDQNNYLEFII